MRPLLLILLLTASFVAPSAQTVTGTITAEGGAALSNVSVRLEGTGLGTITDPDGRFVLSTAPGAYTLVASSVGYETTREEIVLQSTETVTVALVLEAATQDLGEVVVTARETLTGLGVIDLPGSAHYVGPEVLGRFAHGDLHRVLREVPGVQVQEEEGYGLRPNVGLRGTGSTRSSKITLMEDGVLMAPAPYAAPAAYYFPTVGRMDGVEVRTGASQIKYGPYTTGGALNLLAAAIPSAFEARATALAGANGQRTLHARVGESWADLGGVGLGFVVEGYLDNVDGFKRLQGPGGETAEDYNTGFDKGDLFGRLRLSTVPGARVFQALTLTAGYTDEVSNETYLGLTAEDFAATPFVRYAGSQLDRMDAEHLALRARHVAVFSERFDLTTTLYRNVFSRNWYKLDTVADGVADDSTDSGVTDRAFGIAAILDDPVRFADELAVIRGTDGGQLLVKANNRDYYSHGVQSVAGLRLGGGAFGALVEVGVRVHGDGMDRFQWADAYTMGDGQMVLVSEGAPGTDSNQLVDARAVSSFVQAEVTRGRLSLTPGLRYERVTLRSRNYGRNDPERTGADLVVTENTVGALIPGLAALYRVTGALSFFAGVHRGFAPPDTRPETRPEESVNVEAGLRYGTPSLAVQAVGYFHDYANLLGTDLAAGGGTGSPDQFNGGEVDVKGAELSLTADLARPARIAGWAFPLRFAYSFTDARFQSSFVSPLEGWGTVHVGDALPYVPRHQVGASLGAERGPASFALAGAYVSEMRAVAGQGAIPDAERIGSHVVLDAAAEWAVRPQLSLFGRVNNLTDATYLVARRPAGLRPGLPRTIAVGVRARL